MSQKGLEYDILSLSISADGKFLCCGTSIGYVVYNLTDLSARFHRIMGSGFSVAEVMNDCQIVALVGDGKDSKYPPHQLILWDDQTQRQEANITFDEPIQAVKITTKVLVVMLTNHVYVYKMPEVENMEKLPKMKIDSKSASFALSPDEDDFRFVAIPGEGGRIMRTEYGKLFDRWEPPGSRADDWETYLPPPQVLWIDAHKHTLQKMAFSHDGSILATASATGTLIRLWDSASGKKLREFRRGSDPAHIKCLTFSQFSDFCMVSSSKNTIHIFAVPKKKANVKAALSALGGWLGGSSWFGSEWSPVTIPLPYPDVDHCMWMVREERQAHKYTLNVAFANGKVCGYAFDANKNDARKIGTWNLKTHGQLYNEEEAAGAGPAPIREL